MADYRTEFPDFPATDMPEMPTYLTEDTSWHNDACPSFADANCRIRLFIDYAYDADGSLDAVKTWADVVKLIAKEG